jgi:hypothetical protein
MKFKFHTIFTINVNLIVQDYEVIVPQDELIAEIKNIVGFWAEQRLKDEGWPKPNSPTAIREYLLENEYIREIEEETHHTDGFN